MNAVIAFCARLILMAGLAAATTAASGTSIRCDSRIVSTGDRAATVLAVCGQPTYRDRWHTGGYGAYNRLAETEEWYYNFGPNKLLWILRFRNGLLREIESDGHGYATLPSPDCPPVAIVEGLSKFRLLLHCGEPLTREAFPVLAPLRDPRTGETLPGYTPIYRERWVYNFGPRYLMRIVTLEDGRVVSVDTGERGSVADD